MQRGIPSGPRCECCLGAYSIRGFDRPVMIIRAEKQDDERAIARVVEQAFGRTDEARLVDRLRSDGDAVISLVADAGSAILGHVLFSRMRAPFRSLGLAPVSVTPEHQRGGIGKSLVEEGLKRGKDQGW